MTRRGEDRPSGRGQRRESLIPNLTTYPDEPRDLGSKGGIGWVVVESLGNDRRHTFG